jgi:hypothetical protein
MSMEPHAGTCLACIADQRVPIVGEYAGHRRQVVDIAVDDAEKYGDGGLVGGDRIEIANAIALLQHQGWGDACPGGIRTQRAPRPHRQEFRIASSLVASDRLQVHLAC